MSCRVQSQKCWEFWGTEGSSHWMLIGVASHWSLGKPCGGNWIDRDGDRHQFPSKLKLSQWVLTKYHQIRNDRRSSICRWFQAASDPGGENSLRPCVWQHLSKAILMPQGSWEQLAGGRALATLATPCVLRFGNGLSQLVWQWKHLWHALKIREMPCAGNQVFYILSKK